MTQNQQIAEILYKQGFIDNFYCIENKISLRLGARIQDLEEDGWVFRTEKQGKNYFYHVVHYPSTHKPLTKLLPMNDHVRAFNAQFDNPIKKLATLF